RCRRRARRNRRSGKGIWRWRFRFSRRRAAKRDALCDSCSSPLAVCPSVIIEYHLPEVFAMSLVQENPLQAFHWEPQPEAQRFVRGIADDFLRRNTFAADLTRRLKAQT